MAHAHQQPALVAMMTDRVRADLRDNVIRSGAVLRGHTGKDVAAIAVMNLPTGPGEAEDQPDLYTV